MMIPLVERAVIAGKYKLLRKLESGGMGAIWAARHLALDMDVALKLMSATLPDTTEARARFAREARAMARARGPHVVEVLDHGIDGDVPYLVMELLEGEPLGRRLSREGRISLAAASALAEQVARALDRAHRRAIVHRDLKPANLFLARVDDEEVVKVLDFGIAKDLSGDVGEMTQADTLMGSPQYMSPEQARGARDVDARADLWSLGAILFRAITGEHAFEGTSVVDVIVQICAGPVPQPSRVAPELPIELDAFFARALDRDPRRRFAGALEMAAAFSAIAGAPQRPRCLSTIPPPSAGSIRRRVGRVGRDEIEDHEIEGDEIEGATAPSPRDDEIDAFVERAFSALAGPVARVAEDTGAPPTPRSPEVTVPVLRRLGVATQGARAIERREAGASGDRWLAGEPHGRVSFRGAVGALIDEGFTALRHGRRDTARRAWRAALELDPGNRTLEVNLRKLDALGGRSAMGGGSAPRGP